MLKIIWHDRAAREGKGLMKKGKFQKKLPRLEWPVIFTRDH